ncbi:50S ribosomal protein L14 [Saccharolobus solfataricus]|uniref:Large ribosomal subunit protein uL14 n=3 Tax=Saccharolobus solfataricus TaxID=2287 RepID=RL14_SACS2|nr:50S ribosomal protein L14 [Saccharolobus solfataricus]Q9UX97.1 RecName: Full=Large ribosomal subunit protein uL14; AltName: Full=50S ribosomal protein L14 [Saccharolobus solfataricus P2]AAK41009.1 LSU ribosomal protein L14AB (rpl14AB) [Saccharolobus solfataricus P2]AKA74036.1 50S ribosomal protein L14 [Saccharolobus solfataricus]AKA76733.1 50S ribosomal protein L14 [Saccharolobus solfataricus]AKA79427.1 50S ribosomal protein L14 [Saccharolobus solfataricus]AZF68514.1 50S ribosomal protein 
MSEKIQVLGSRKGLTPALQHYSVVNVADNSGGKEAMIIGVYGYRGVLRRVPFANIADMVMVSIKKGTPEVRKQKFRAVIVRQRMPYRRPDGTWISFEDNAVVIINPDGTPKGTEVRGPIAREAAERWPKIASLATLVV